MWRFIATGKKGDLRILSNLLHRLFNQIWWQGWLGTMSKQKNKTNQCFQAQSKVNHKIPGFFTKGSVYSGVLLKTMLCSWLCQAWFLKMSFWGRHVCITFSLLLNFSWEQRFSIKPLKQPCLWEQWLFAIPSIHCNQLCNITQFLSITASLILILHILKKVRLCYCSKQVHSSQWQTVKRIKLLYSVNHWNISNNFTSADKWKSLAVPLMSQTHGQDFLFWHQTGVGTQNVSWQFISYYTELSDYIHQSNVVTPIVQQFYSLMHCKHTSCTWSTGPI